MSAHRRRLDRDLHVVEADLVEVGQLHLGPTRPGPRGWPRRSACRGPCRGPGVDPDADGDAAVLGLRGHLLDLRLLAQVARVEPQALDPRLEGGQRHLVVEVDVGDDRHRRAGHDLGQALGRRLLVAGAAHDVGAGRRPARRSGRGCPRRRRSWWSSSTGPRPGVPPPTATAPTWIWRVAPSRTQELCRQIAPLHCAVGPTAQAARPGSAWNGLATGCVMSR